MGRMTNSRIATVLVALAGLAVGACQPEIATPAGALAIPKLEPQSRTLANGLRVYASAGCQHSQRFSCRLVRRRLEGRPAPGARASRISSST